MTGTDIRVRVRIGGGTPLLHADLSALDEGARSERLKFLAEIGAQAIQRPQAAPLEQPVQKPAAPAPPPALAAPPKRVTPPQPTLPLSGPADQDEASPPPPARSAAAPPSRPRDVRGTLLGSLTAED